MNHLFLLLVLLLPLTVSVWTGLTGSRLEKVKLWAFMVVSGFVLGICSYLFVLSWFSDFNRLETMFRWITFDEKYFIDFSLVLDKISALMLLVVSVISFAVYIYSIGYKKGDRDQYRYFAYLGLFISSMFLLALSGNLLVLFMAWELVGFCSYLLIGFWFDKEKAAQASLKAFLVNRVSDLFFLVGIMMIWTHFGTLNIGVLSNMVTPEILGTPLCTAAGFCLFIGAAGKSAQFPFQAWLPDAMEGPTPVSALIHAATMVAAGIYLLCRMYFLLNANVLPVIALTGSITALWGVFCACTQNDIKRVLAFSTISQLGVMMIGIGCGSWQSAFFHLFTHAFFKAGLFLCAGSVIHALHHVQKALETEGYHTHFDKQDMRQMGGLRHYLPFTFIAYTFCAAGLAGLPFFSGFLSKEMILNAAFQKAQSGDFIYVLTFFTLLLSGAGTAFYMARQWLMVFFGTCRLLQNRAYPTVSKLHEGTALLYYPTLFLAVCSLFLPFSLNPFSAAHNWFFEALKRDVPHLLWLEILSAMNIGLAFGLAFYYFHGYSAKSALRNRFYTAFYPVYKLSYFQFYIDQFYKDFLVKPTLSIASIAQKSDTKYLNRFIDVFGIAQVVTAHVINWLDKKLVDGSINTSARMAIISGNQIRNIQGSKVQHFLLLALAGLLFIGILMLV